MTRAVAGRGSATPPTTIAATPMARARDIASTSMRAPTTRTAPAALTSMRDAGASASGPAAAMTIRPAAGRPQPIVGRDPEALGADVDAAGQCGATIARSTGAWTRSSPLPAARRVMPSRPCSKTRVWNGALSGCAGRDGRSASTGTSSRMAAGGQADDGGRRRDLDSLLLPEALDDGLAELDALARQRPAVDPRDGGRSAAADRGSGRWRRARSGLGSRLTSTVGHDLTARCPARPGAPRPRAAARRCSALLGSDRGIGRVSMRRPPSPPLTSRRRRRPSTPRMAPMPGSTSRRATMPGGRSTSRSWSGSSASSSSPSSDEIATEPGSRCRRPCVAGEQGAADGQEAVVHEVGQEAATVALRPAAQPSGASRRAWSCRIVDAPGWRMPSAMASAAAAGGRTLKPPPLRTRTSAAASSARPSAAASQTALQPLEGGRAGRPGAGAGHQRRSATRAPGSAHGGGRGAWPGPRARSTSEVPPQRRRRPSGSRRGSRPAGGQDGVPDLAIRMCEGPAARGRADLDALDTIAAGGPPARRAPSAARHARRPPPPWGCP